MQLEQIVTSLRNGGHRITPQRIAIIDYLMHTEDHPSADQVHVVIKKKYPMVSLSTVYKTLELLRQKKLVNEIEIDGGARFDAHMENHINLVCLNCGKIEDIDEKVIGQNLTTAEMPDPDLMIRSGGEHRISNFLIWQIAYSELFVTNVLWPDFNCKNLIPD